LFRAVSSQGNRLFIGFVVALILGGGGGFALGPLAANERMQPPAPPASTRAAQSRVVIESVKGQCKVLTPSGQWRLARDSETLERPTGVRAEGPEASITVYHAGVRVIAQHDARVMIGQSAGSIAVEVDAGQAVIHSSAGRIRVMVPAAQATITGDAFGLWARKDETRIAVLDGEIGVDTPSLSTKFAAGREVLLNSQGASPSVLAPQLKMESQRIDRAGVRYMVSAKTSPNAVVMVRRNGRYEEVPVSAYGAFTAAIDGPRPQDGELVAYDAAGRRAQLDRASETLDRVLATISKGGAVAMAGVPMKTSAEDAQAIAQPEPKKEAVKKEEAREDRRPEKKAEVEKAVAEPKHEKEAPLAEKADKTKKKPGKRKELDVRGDNVPKPVRLDLGGAGGDSVEEAQPAKKEAPPKKQAPSKGEGDEEKGIELEWGQ
jgi:hypothetical protein